MKTLTQTQLSEIHAYLTRLTAILEAPSAPTPRPTPSPKLGRPINPRSLRQRAFAQFDKGRSWKQTLHTLGPAGLTYSAVHTYLRGWKRIKAGLSARG